MATTIPSDFTLSEEMRNYAKSVNYKKEPDDVYICKDFVLYE